jgi:predicted regulator of Ras-like GTPase activity (Roadblock/LC7/MglB family)
MVDSVEAGGGDLKPILSEMISKSNALTALVVSKEGISIAESGDTSYLNTTALAALVAGMFSATREVARLVGEQQFSILLQQGEKRHIHISLILDAHMLVVVFEDYRRIGLVRHEARQAAEKIATELESNPQREAQGEVIGTPQFKEFALNLIDKIFEVR